MSKVLKGIIIILIILVIAITIYSYDDSIKTYSITNFDIDAIVQENGDVKVVETTDYKFKGQYNGITITLPYSLGSDDYNNKTGNNKYFINQSIYNNSDIKNIEIYTIENGIKKFFDYSEDASLGSSGVYSTSIDNGYITYKIFEPSYNENKTFVIEYVLVNVAVKHTDVAEFYWNFVGGNVECNISNLNISVGFEKENNIEDLRGYTHGNFTGTAKVENGSVFIHYDNVFKGEYVGVRTTFSNSAINNSNKTSNIEGLPEIISEEQVIEAKTAKRVILNAVAIISGIFLVFYWIFLMITFEKDHAIFIEPDDELKVLEKYNPMVAACISQARDMHPRDIIATLINLVNKKVLSMETRHDPEDLNKKLYCISKNKDFFSNVNNIHNIDQIEKLVIGIFFDKNDEIELKQYTKNLSQNTTSVEKIQALDKYVTHHLENIGANKEKMPKIILYINNIIFAIVCLFIVYVIGYNILIGTSFVFTDMLMRIILGAIVLFPLFLFLLCIIIVIIKCLTRLISKSVGKIAYKILPKDIFVTIVEVLFASLIVFIILAIFVGSTYVLAVTFLFAIAFLIIKTDNLMNKHSKEMMKDFFILKSIETKIIEGTFDHRNIESQIVWDKYLTFAISLGATSVSEYSKHLDITDDFNDLLNVIEQLDLYSIYAASRDSLTSKELSSMLHSINKIRSSWANNIGENISSGGFSGGGSSFGGGGFSGGGGGGGGRGAF